MSSFNITIFSKWKRNFLALTRKRHPGFQAIGRDIQVFGQWQKTSRFSCCCKRQPSKVWSVTLLHGEASLPGWLDFVLTGHHHQSPINHHHQFTIPNHLLDFLLAKLGKSPMPWQNRASASATWSKQWSDDNLYFENGDDFKNNYDDKQIPQDLFRALHQRVCHIVNLGAQLSIF